MGYETNGCSLLNAFAEDAGIPAVANASYAWKSLVSWGGTRHVHARSNGAAVHRMVAEVF